MLLGICLYRPIFSTFLKETDAKQWTAENNLIKIAVDTVEKKSDTKTLLEVSTKYKTYFGTNFTQQHVDTLFTANSEIKTGKTVYINKVLNLPLYIEFIFLVWLMVLFVTMVYGPIAAFLVELFPTKIRYTSMSLPYHIGNGVFGGLVPFLATLIVEYTKTTDNPTGDPLAGLWYPIIVASFCFIIGAVYLTNKKEAEVMD